MYIGNKNVGLTTACHSLYSSTHLSIKQNENRKKKIREAGGVGESSEVFIISSLQI